MSLGELERKSMPSPLLGNGKHFQNTNPVTCKTFYQCSPFFFFFLLGVQECSTGFYRENKGLFAGRCVPCNCNGNSNRCQDGTGKCIDCQYNTAGEKCEHCKDGYFGDATQGSCRECPCPYTNRFASGCVANGEDIQCLCKEGYTGSRCERCATGYFGNPQKYGGFCQKCNCNNNGQLASCDHLTGECFNNDPKDVDPNEDCDSCDSCVITLLKDLSTIGDELQLIKSQLQNVHASTHTLEQMRDLETRIKDLKVLLNNYRSVVHNQGSKVDELETDFIELGRAINALQEKAEMNYKEAERLFNNFGQTHQKGKDLVSQIQVVVKNIQVLARVKNELQKYHQENRGLIKVVRDALNEYESKITDLREALNDATGQIKQAEGLNRDNTVLLEDIKKRVEKTNVQQNGVLNILSLARSSLTQNHIFLKPQEYETLAAQLDGARKDMNEKVANLSSASKEPLVVRAEEHAKSLQDSAKRLEETKNSFRTDKLINCAVEASTAYDNIIGAIKAAEEAANQAGKAADSALSTVKREDLSGKAARLKTESSALMDQAQETKRTLQGTKKESGTRNESACSFLCVSGDIDSIITSARSMAENANSVTNSVLDDLVPIKEEVERIKSNYGSTQSARFNKALMEANSSVKNLTNQLPDLFSKIKSINQQLMPITNISENINRIRELIQQARDAANKVAIPMRFNGSSGVEVRPPSNLEDLKGYTSLSLFIQRPQQEPDTPQRANRFVLYLGNKDASKDYIGMAVKDGYLTCVYNLGGGDGEVRVQSLMTESKTEEAVMDQVTFERIYQYAKLKYIKAATSTSPDHENPRSASSGDSDMLLNLDPSSVVFYVGGYPPDFRPPRNLNYPRYEGCIELNSLNEHIISLYNFKRTFNLNTTDVQPCRRYKEETDQSYFEGTGYASVIAAERIAQQVRYEQTIETTADEGIVFFAANGDQFISVLIKNGHTVLRYKLDSETPKEIEAKNTVNDGTYQQVSFIGYCGVVSALKCQATELFFLPLPETSFNISTPPFRGCMKNVKNPSTASVVFDKTFGVSKKCSDDWKVTNTFPQKLLLEFQTLFLHLMVDDESKAVDSPRSSNSQQSNRPIKFGGDNFEELHFMHFVCFPSLIILKLHFAKMLFFYVFSLGNRKDTTTNKIDLYWNMLTFHYRLHFSIDVRTRSSRGLIVFMEESSEDSYVALHISKGHIVFSLGSGEKQIKVKTSIKYNDGQWHTVVFSTDGKSARLVVDGLRAQHRKLATNAAISIKPPVYVGGLPPLKKQNIPMKSFKGCLRNFMVNGKVMNAPQQKNGVLPCLDVPMDTGIYFFNEGGYITIGKLCNLLMGLDFRIVFTIRPRSSTGILLHAGSRQDNYLTVYMKGGKVIAAGNSDAGEFQVSVSPKKPLSDGQWHTIAGTLDGGHRALQLQIFINYFTSVHGVVNLHGCPEE
uniref:Laminin subunit alpha 3 n=1 Tax=Cyanoderma ruficeps TaxID=181631 RepID=A0A8C3XFQ3_9PASS